MKSIRCGRGLGDTLYLQSVVRHLVLNGEEDYTVASDYPDVLKPLGKRVEVVPFTRRADITAHYVSRKAINETSQFEDCCIKAGIEGPAELVLDWQVEKPGLIDKVREPGKPVVVVQLPRNPMGRLDGFGASLLPDCRAIQHYIEQMSDTHTIVQIGAGNPLFKFRCIDFDFANKTSISEMLDIASAADRFLGYCSFLVPLAESFGKPGLFVWSARGLRDGRAFIRQITPEKVLHRSTSEYVIDEEVLRAVH